MTNVRRWYIMILNFFVGLLPEAFELFYLRVWMLQLIILLDGSLTRSNASASSTIRIFACYAYYVRRYAIGR